MPTIITDGAASAQGYGFAAKSAAVNYIEDVFSTYLYTGNGSSTTGQTITNNVDLSTKGGLVWIKCRDGANDHVLFDTARGAGTTASNNQALSSNLTAAEDIGSSIDYLSSFNADGFTVKRGGTYAPTLTANTSGTLYTSWTFRKQAKFFDVVTYTGTGISSQTISHSLASIPGFIAIKRTDSAGDWVVIARSSSNGQYYCLQNATTPFGFNSTNAAYGTVDFVGFGSLTSTNFLPYFFGGGNSSSSGTNISGATYVAYLFAHDAGGFGAAGTDNVISCGSFTKSAGVEATITLGYEPQWLLFKRTDAVENWFMIDNMRGMTVGGTDAYLIPNLSSAENNLDFVTPTATGFIATNNFNTGTYIYIAIRRGPMKTPTSGTSVFSPLTSSGATGTTLTTNFPVDMQWLRTRDTADAFNVIDRMRGISTTPISASTKTLFTTGTFGEGNYLNSYGWNNTGFGVPTQQGGSSTIYESFRRAPGFFDVVCYTGTGANRTVSHNLGVAPELIIVKQRSGSGYGQWFVYVSALGNTKMLQLESTYFEQTDPTAWNNTSPTNSVFSVGTAGGTNYSSSTFVAYLFATLAGVSKVGSYTGTGTTKQIDCGFTSGARFVLIKRTDSTGDWYVWDSARGIVAGNDPYLLLNSTAAEVTGTDYVDTYSAGFEISSTAPAAINANGGSFIFLAIA